MTTQQSNLPPAARRQVNEANRLIAELNAAPGQVPAGVEVQVMPGDQQPGSNQVENVPQHQAPPPAPELAQVQVQPPQPQAADSFEHKYNVLQGKYNSETATMREVLRQQQVTLDKVMETALRPQTPAVPVQELSPEEFLKSIGVTDKEIADYGELLPIVAKIARNMVRPTMEKLDAEIARVKQNVGAQQGQLVKSGQESLYSVLDSRVRNWRVINESQEFLAWLDVVDIFSGLSRRNALTAAFNSLDTARVVGIFERFVQEDSVNRSASGPMVNLETLIAPGSPRAGAAEAPGDAKGRKIWSEGEIRDFYSRVRRKAISAEEYKTLSVEIAAAAAEGRVKPDRPDHHRNN